jgi:glycosyltransferase involved in cell wall biosynthesis
VGTQATLDALSVVIPTYDRRALLETTLDSVAALDPAPGQVIVVSDGSTDGSDEVVEARGLELVRTDRAGAGGARNAGWQAAGGEIVAFLDDDCVAAPGWAAALVDGFTSPSVGFVQGQTIPAGPVGRHDRTIHVKPEQCLYESCNIAYRRDALVEVGGFDVAWFERVRGRRRGPGRPFGEDTDLAWRVRRAGWQPAYAPDALVRHHVFPGTFGDSLREEWRAGNFAMLLREVPELRDQLPGGRWFLRRHGPLIDAGLVGLLLAASGRRRAAVLAVPYLAWLLANRRGTDIVEQALRDGVGSVGRIVGSVRAGSVVL